MNVSTEHDLYELSKRVDRLENIPVIDTYLSGEVIELCNVIVEMIDTMKRFDKRLATLEDKVYYGPDGYAD